MMNCGMTKVAEFLGLLLDNKLNGRDQVCLYVTKYVCMWPIMYVCMYVRKFNLEYILKQLSQVARP